MPPPSTYLRFKNFLHSEKAPFAIYADFESLIKPMENCDPDPNKSYTKKYQKHEPISFSYYILCSIDGIYKPVLRKYTQTKPKGANSMDVFINMVRRRRKSYSQYRRKGNDFYGRRQKTF